MNIRFKRTVVLNVEFDGKKFDMRFGGNEIYPVKLIKEDKNGDYTIIIKDGTILRGIREDVFRPMGQTKIQKYQAPKPKVTKTDSISKPKVTKTEPIPEIKTKEVVKQEETPKIKIIKREDAKKK